MKRLILFDIDGTLLSGGPAKEAFRLAMVEVFGTAGPIDR
jgi:hydroxymethylpyrimidine pyrophosphatase-like HAD family hydrolase